MSAVSKADVLETYADLYDVFEDNKAIRKELDKIYDRLNTLPSIQPEPDTRLYSDGFCDGYKQGIKDAQSEIVRCKDCKHWREHKYAKETKRYIPFCGLNAIYTKSDDFCSRAERREG